MEMVERKESDHFYKGESLEQTDCISYQGH